MDLSIAAPVTVPTAPDAARAPWTQKFIGRSVAYYAGEFPHPEGIFAHAAQVLGDPTGYASLADARAAVKELRPDATRAGDPKDPKTFPKAVAYLESDEGRFGAFELDKPLLTWKGLFRVRWHSAPYYDARDERVRAIDNFQGEVPQRSVREGAIVV